MKPVCVAPARERGMREDVLEEGEVGRRTEDRRCRAARPQAAHARVARSAPQAETFASSGSYSTGTTRAGRDAGVDAHAGRRPARAATRIGPALGRKPARRILGADAHLDRVAAARDVVLREAAAARRGDAELRRDQVDAGDPAR